MVGEANIDLLLYGIEEEVPIERELLADKMELQLGGSPAITAHNLAALGSRVGFVTPVATDLFSDYCQQHLERAGVNLTRRVPAPAGVGTGVTVFLQHEESRHAFTYAGMTKSLTLRDLDLDYLSSARHFHLSSYFLQEGLRKDVPKLFSELKKAGLTISMDTNDDPSGQWTEEILEALPYVDVLLPNQREACALAREADWERATAKLLRYCPTLVVKQGRLGAVLVTKEVTLQVPPFAVDPIDAVGAGDSFNAGFLHGYAQGWSLERCARFGNLIGAFSTTAVGGTAAFRNRDQMQSFLAQHESFAHTPWAHTP
jgi:sugar/nucleoside kinase (ribokinase family)